MNISGIQNASGFGEVAVWTNNSVNGLLFTGGLYILFVILLLVFKSKGESIIVSLSAASWIMFIISGLFWFGKMVSWMLPIQFLIVAAITVFILSNDVNPYG
jgi:hypothetical protein